MMTRDQATQYAWELTRKGVGITEIARIMRDKYVPEETGEPLSPARWAAAIRTYMTRAEHWHKKQVDAKLDPVRFVRHVINDDTLDDDAKVRVLKKYFE